jgi:hypothetical protein
MLKKILLGFCFVNCLSYACEQASTSASAVTVPSVVLPDISPKAFGVSGSENYLIALHDYAQALLMQHRFFEARIAACEMEESINGLHLDDIILVKNTLDRIAWLEQLPETGDDKTLQEIKQAIKTHADHELLFWSGGGFPIFAATPESIGLLLKYRSLFVNDIVDLKDRTLIDKICREAMRYHENNEVQLLAEILKLKLKQAQLNADLDGQMIQRVVSEKDAKSAVSIMEMNETAGHYKLSQELFDSLRITPKWVFGIENFLLSPDAKIPGNPTKFKLWIITQYNMTQPAIYAAVRKKLKEITLQLAKKSRRVLVYSKTAKGEPLPEQIQVLNRGDLECRQEVTAVNKSIKPKDTHQVKQRATKTQKKKGKSPERKDKKHQQLAGCSVSKDGSEKTEEQDLLEASSSQGAQPVQGAVPVAVQEGHQKVSVNPDSCVEQDVVQAAVLVPAPSAEVVSEATVSKRERHKEKGKAPAAVEPSAGCPEVSLVVGIPDYSDGTVLSAVDGQNVIIDDSCNGMRIQLFPTEEGRPHFARKLCYQANVLLWFQSVKRALQEQGYLDPSNKKYVRTESEAYKTVRIHRFSQLVDRFLPTMGVKGSMPSRLSGHADEISVAIPGYVEFSGEKKKNPCLFAYLINSDTHRCFHRNIEFRIGQRMIADFFKKGYFEVEFPSLDWQRH